MTLFTYLLKRFYNKDKPCIYPVMQLLILFGLRKRGRGVMKTIIVSIFLIFFNLFLISVIANLIINFNYYILMEFTQNSPYYLSVYILTTIFFQHERWEQLIKLIIEIENKSLIINSQHKEIVYKYKNYSQFIIYGYYMIFVPLLTFFFAFFWLNNVIIPYYNGTNDPFVSAYYILLPFDQNAHNFASAFIQTFFGLTSSIPVWTWHTFVLSCAMFFVGQLKAIRTICVNVVIQDDEEQSIANVVACHQLFVDVLRCNKMFNSLIQWVAFPQLLQMSFVCGVCVIKAVLDDDPAVVTKSITMFIGLNLQWALFYGTANQVIVNSLNLSYGIFESSWVGSSARVRRAVFMLGMGMRQRVAFTAGPFNEMSLQTLSSIWRATYSIYAVLSQSVSAE